MPAELNIQCPYCGEAFDVFVDDSAGDQAYIEDCVVCCRPIEFRLSIDLTGSIDLQVSRDDE